MSIDLGLEEYAHYATSLGTPVEYRAEKDTDIIYICTEENSYQMRVIVDPPNLTYLYASQRATMLRLDAPLVHQMALQGEPFVAMVRLEAPSDVVWILRSVRVTLYCPVGGTLHDTEMVATIEQHDGANLQYHLSGPIGLADLELLVADALMTAEPVDEADCQGDHAGMPEQVEPYSGPLASVRDHAALRYKVCQRCLDHLAHLGFPIAPTTPRGW